MRRSFALLFSAFVIWIPHSAAAADNKVPIFHSYIGEDALGKRFDSSLSDYFKASPKFREVGDTRESAFDLYITTRDPAGRGQGPGRGLQTAYSYAFTFKVVNADRVFNSYVRSGVGVCPVSDVRACAADMFDYMGEMVDEIEKLLKAQPARR
jgi:hypothetical protein